MVRTCSIIFWLIFSTAVSGQTILDWSNVSTSSSGTATGFPLTTNIFKGNGVGGILSAYPGVDYQAVFSFSAFNYGNGATNGIANATTNCGSTPCQVIIPSSYPTSEQVSGVSYNSYYTQLPPPAVTNLSNVGYIDYRLGGMSPINFNCPGASGYSFCSYGVYNLINLPAVTSNPSTAQIIGNMSYETNVIDGGLNCNGDGCYNKTSWQPYIFTLDSWAPGQHIPLTISGSSYSLGDTVGLDLTLHCYGGLNAPSDEGCEPYDIEEYGPVVDATMTVTSVSGSQVTGNFTAGSGTQGTGRFFIKTNALTNSVGTIYTISCPGTDACTETGVGTNWVPTSGFGTIGTAITGNAIAPSTQVVNLTFTTGTSSSITPNSTAVCISGVPGTHDGGTFEIVKPTAVGVNNMTATFYKSHAVGSYFSTSSLGGCGYATSLTAENVTNSNSNVYYKSQTIVGTEINAIPVLEVMTSTTRKVHYVSTGQWDVWQSLLTLSNNTYTDYTFAEAYSVQSQKSISNVVTLGPNIMSLSAGDIIQQPHYFAQRVGPGQIIFENYLPATSFVSGAFGIQYRQPLASNDSMLSLSNEGVTSLYEGNGPLEPGPTAINISGESKYSILSQYTPFYAFAAIGCPATDPCSRFIPLFNIGNGDSGSDIFGYDQASGAERWQLTTKNGTGSTFNFYSTGFDLQSGQLSIDNSPIPILLTSPTSTLLIGLGFNHPPQYEGIEIGCDSPCTTAYNYLGAKNAAGNDYLQYNQAFSQWIITTNSNTNQYTFGSSQFTTPFFGVTSGIFSTNITYSAADVFQFSNVATIQQASTCNFAYLGLLFPVGYNTGSAGLEFCILGQGGSYDLRYIGQGNNNVTYSSTAAFSTQATSNSIYLTGNLAFTIPAGFDGQEMDVRFCQDTVGSHLVTPPSNVRNFFSSNSGQIGLTGNTCSYTRLKYYFLYGTNWYAIDSGYINVPI